MYVERCASPSARVFPVRDRFPRNARFNHVDNKLEPEVIEEKRRRSRGNNAVVLRPLVEDQVDDRRCVSDHGRVG